MSEMETKILDLAEHSIRTRGFHAVSFRDIAAELGIKSASVHYHFRRKEDLAQAVIARYRTRFFAGLDDSEAEPEAALIAAYAGTLAEDELICLCGMLGAEIDGLPQAVADDVGDFLAANVEWLMDRDVTRDRAAHVVATLQGGMLLSRALEDPSLFVAAISGLRQAPQTA